MRVTNIHTGKHYKYIGRFENDGVYFVSLECENGTVETYLEATYSSHFCLIKN